MLFFQRRIIEHDFVPPVQKKPRNTLSKIVGGQCIISDQVFEKIQIMSNQVRASQVLRQVVNFRVCQSHASIPKVKLTVCLGLEMLQEKMS